MTEPLRPPNVFDRKAALTRVGGDEELLRELTAVFLADAAGWRNEAHAAAARGDAEALRRAAHTIKGAVSYFGADEAFAAAARVETSVASAKPPPRPPLWLNSNVRWTA